MNSVGHLATVIIFDLIKIIILANLGIFLELIAAEEAQVHAIPTDSSPKLGVAPNFEGAQWSRALQPAQTIRKQVAVTDGDEQISGFKIDTSNRLANLISYPLHGRRRRYRAYWLGRKRGQQRRGHQPLQLPGSRTSLDQLLPRSSGTANNRRV